jgi:hypothetical protein
MQKEDWTCSKLAGLPDIRVLADLSKVHVATDGLYLRGISSPSKGEMRSLSAKRGSSSKSALITSTSVSCSSSSASVLVSKQLLLIGHHLMFQTLGSPCPDRLLSS